MDSASSATPMSRVPPSLEFMNAAMVFSDAVLRRLSLRCAERLSRSGPQQCSGAKKPALSVLHGARGRGGRAGVLRKRGVPTVRLRPDRRRFSRDFEQLPPAPHGRTPAQPLRSRRRAGRDRAEHGGVAAPLLDFVPHEAWGSETCIPRQRVHSLTSCASIRDSRQRNQSSTACPSRKGESSERMSSTTDWPGWKASSTSP